MTSLPDQPCCRLHTASGGASSACVSQRRVFRSMLPASLLAIPFSSPFFLLLLLTTISSVRFSVDDTRSSFNNLCSLLPFSSSSSTFCHFYSSFTRTPQPITLASFDNNNNNNKHKNNNNNNCSPPSPFLSRRFFTVAYALPTDDEVTVTFAFSSTTLLSGSLTACRPNATVSTCVGGFPAFMAYGRNLTNTNFTQHIVYIPEIDVSTPFVQMHPEGYAINLHIFDHVGIDTYIAKPSLMSSRVSPNYSALYNDSVTAIMTNAKITASDDWFDYVKHRKIYSFDGVSVGLLYITPSLQQYSLGAVETLRPAVRALRRSVDVVVVIYQDREVVGLDALEALAEYGAEDKSLPDVLIDVGSKSSPTTIVNGNFNGTHLWNGTVQIDGYGIYLTFTVSKITSQVVSANVRRETLASLPASLKDSAYFDLQAYLLGLSSAAASNDPILSHTAVAVEKSRVDGYYPCFGGECVQGTLVARAIAWRYDTDIGFLNSGGPRGPGWPAGPVKTSDVWAFQTFSNMPCVGSVMGLKIWELVNASMAYCTFSSAYSTVGDRFIQFYGLQIDYDNSTAAALAGTRVRAIRVLDRKTGVYEPLERLKLYSFATDTYQCTGMPVASPIIMNMREGETIATTYNDELLQIAIQQFLREHDPYEPVFQNYLKQVPLTATESAAMSADSSPSYFMKWTQSLSTCSFTEYWDAGQATCIACPDGYQRDVHASDNCVPIPSLGNKESSNTTVIIAIVIPVVIVLMLILAAAFYFRANKNVRDTKYAPKGDTATIIFTDIQMSTKLWGTVPASMGAALDQHHAMIRDLIHVHKAYEVKTVGDSFMIAVETPQQAIELSMQIQTLFMGAKWPRCIDMAYAAEVDKELLDEIDDNPEDLSSEGFEFVTVSGLNPTGIPQPGRRNTAIAIIDPNAKPPPSISQHFHGVRVRIGIHYGPVDAVFDEVSKGYDYYGNTVNVAARLEAAGDGGQIIMSRQVANNIAMDDSLFRVQLLGEVQLKGVIGTTELLQIAPLSLVNRIFTANAIEKVGIQNQNEEERERKSNSSRTSKCSVAQSVLDGSAPLNERDLLVRDALVRALKPLSADVRTKQVEQLGKAWRIRPPPTKKTDAEKTEVIMGVIAQRVGASLPAGTRYARLLAHDASVISGDGAISLQQQASSTIGGAANGGGAVEFTRVGHFMSNSPAQSPMASVNQIPLSNPALSQRPNSGSQQQQQQALKVFEDF